MKIKNLSAGMKFLIAAIIVVAIAAAVIGVSDIFAEPTIEDLAAPYVHEIGTFKPDKVYDGSDQDVTLVAWLNTTQTIFSYDWWKDTSGDGKIDVEDVYSQEGFEQEMLLGTAIYPIFDVDPNLNYYVISFPDFERYNGVIVDLKIAENNDHANLKDESSYWFDRTNNNLYIRKDMIKADIENEYFNSIRMQTVMLVKELKGATKDVDVASLFSSEIKNLHGLNTSTPNGSKEFNIEDWLTYGLRYQLVQSQDLAYVSTENLTVFVNGMETDQWSYNATTGEITIGCSPYKTNEVVVRFNSLNDVSIEQKTLQWFQASDNTAVAQSADLKTVLDEQGNNIYLTKINYEDKEPEIGAFNRLGFAAYAAVRDDGTVHNLANMFNTSEESVSNTLITIVEKHMSDEKMLTMKEKTGHFSGHTLSAFQTGKGSSVSHKYGNVVYNMWLANKEKDSAKASEHLKNAVAAAEADLLTKVSDEMDYSKLLTTSWDSWNKWDDGKESVDLDHDGKRDNIDGRYLLGTWVTDNFLGGKIGPNDGHAIFDVVCAHIEAPNATITDIMKAQGGINSGADCLGTNATIVDIKKDEDGQGGYLYVCIWSRVITGYKEDIGADKSHDQRVLSFARIRYEYDGVGTIIFTKTNSKGEYVAGADYEVYDNKECTGTPVTTFTTNDKAPITMELKQGTYYIKEKKAPVGYLRQDVVEVQINGGETKSIKATEPVQEYQFDLYVYDQTTEAKDNRPQEPVEGIQFQLYAPESDEPLKDSEGNALVFTTDVNGKIHFSIPAIGAYRLVQIDTVTNYCMEVEDKDSRYYCKQITCACDKADCHGENIIPAYPDDSQKHITGHNIVHYEQRQTVAIKSHVQDINLKDKTSAVIGGDVESGSLTIVEGSVYSLYAKSDLFLGYYKGEKITVKAGELLEITDGTLNPSGDTHYLYSTTVVAKRNEDNDNGKAYVSATRIRVTVKDGDKTTKKSFLLPNGEYEWKLVEVKSGYYNNGQVTPISAPWSPDNKYIKHIQIIDKPVRQTRQTASLTLFAKSYVNRYTEAKDMLKHDGYPIRDNAYTSIFTNTEEALKNPANIPVWQKFINTQWTKTITSNTSTVTETSVETATLYKNGTEYLSVRTSGLVPNSIYQLVNLGDIVDINTGDIIPAGSILGYHITDKDGVINITGLGSEEIVNPNKETEQAEPVLEAIPLDGALPNGRYVLLLRVPADEHRREVFSNDIILDVIWQAANSNKSNIEQEAISLMWHEPPHDKPTLEIPVAPSPIPDDPDEPGGPNDPYDPDHPDDPDDPDDSDDIPRVDIDWVDKNKNNIAYRVVDSDNIGLDGKNEVSDKLPTTFAFYLGNDLIIDGEYEFTHKLSFYYQITKEEYDAAVSAPGYDRSTKEYIPLDGVYLRRFEYGEFSGGKELTDTIVLNELSDGYISYDRINENTTISGAIFDDEWLNEKLSKSDDGSYHIYIIVDSSMTYKVPFSGEIVTQYFTSFKRGVLTIKSRELTPLD
jgi:hypothetical protein